MGLGEGRFYASSPSWPLYVLIIKGWSECAFRAGGGIVRRLFRVRNAENVSRHGQTERKRERLLSLAVPGIGCLDGPAHTQLPTDGMHLVQQLPVLIAIFLCPGPTLVTASLPNPFLLTATGTVQLIIQLLRILHLHSVTQNK